MVANQGLEEDPLERHEIDDEVSRESSKRAAMLEDDGQLPGQEESVEVLCELLSDLSKAVHTSKDCLQEAQDKFLEANEFERGVRDRRREKDLSEATLRKINRKSDVLVSEARARISRAYAQLRHVSQNFLSVQKDVSVGLVKREEKLAERHRVDAYVGELKKEKNRLEAAAAKLEGEKEELVRMNARLEEQIDGMQQTKANTVDEIENMRRAVAKARDEVADAERERDKATIAKDSAVNKVRKLQEELERAANDAREATANERIISRKLSKSRETVAKLTADNLTQVGKLKFLEGKLAESSDETARLKKALDSQDEQWFAQLRLELERVSRAHILECEAFESRLEEAATQRDSARATSQKVIDDLRSKLDTTRSELEDARAALGAGQGRNDGLAGEVKVLQDRVQAAEADRNRALNESESLQAEMDDLRNEKELLNDQLTKTEDRLKEIMEENIRSRTHSANNERALRDAQRQLSSEREVNSELLREKAKHDELVLRLKAEKSVLCRELEMNDGKLHSGAGINNQSQALPISGFSPQSESSKSASSESTSASGSPEWV